MEPISSPCLNNTQLDDIAHLEQLCTTKDSVKYSVYYDNESHDINCFFLLYIDNELIAYAGCFITDDVELSLVIHPDFRKEKIYEQFLDYIMDELWEQGIEEFFITGNKELQWFSQILEFCDAIFSHSEYLMTIKELNGNIDIPAIEYTIDTIEESDCTVYRLIIGEKETGHCNVTESGDLVNIWGVYIDPDMRNKSLGKLLMQNVVASLLPKYHNKKIILQVSSNNRPACSLYNACGFIMEDSIDYFRISL